MLKYKVLWVDDSKESAETKAEGITDFLAGEGFVFEPIIKEKIKGIETCLDDPELDIVITDFNLIGGTAEDLITKVRAADKYIEIILYSENPPKEFKQVLAQFQGIYGCTRSDVESTIRNVIKNTIRRTQHVSNMRGIVISEAIDIENQIEDIILAYYSNKEKYLAKELLGGDTCNELGPKIKYLKEIILNGMVTELNKDAIDGSDAKKKKAKEILKMLEPLHTVAKKLTNEVGMRRNMLAHVEHVVDGNKVCLKALRGGYEDMLIDSKKCKDIRQALMKHSANLNKIKDFLSMWHEYKKT